MTAKSFNFFWENVPIIEDDLVPLIKAKSGCGHFKLNIQDIDETPAFTEIPIQEPKQEIIELEIEGDNEETEEEAAKFSNFIAENPETKRIFQINQKAFLNPSPEMISDITKQVIRAASDFLNKEYGEFPTLGQRFKMVKIIMKLFHFLSLEQQAVCKMLNTRIKYARKNRFSNNYGDEFQTPHKKSKNEDLKDTTPNIQEDIAFLEECNTAIDVPRIKSALERTLSHRMGQYTQENFSVINTYRFFTKSLNLVGFLLDCLYIF